MLLTQSLPPQFLLPSWNTRQLASAIQRAHISDIQSSDASTKAPHPMRVRKLFMKYRPVEPSTPTRMTNTSNRKGHNFEGNDEGPVRQILVSATRNTWQYQRAVNNAGVEPLMSHRDTEASTMRKDTQALSTAMSEARSVNDYGLKGDYGRSVLATFRSRESQPQSDASETSGGTISWENLGAVQVAEQEPHATSQATSVGAELEETFITDAKLREELQKIIGDTTLTRAAKRHRAKRLKTRQRELNLTRTFHDSGSLDQTSAMETEMREKLQDIYGNNTTARAVRKGREQDSAVLGGKEAAGSKYAENHRRSTAPAGKAPPKRQLSLFEELFPELLLPENYRAKAALDRIEELPAFNWKGADTEGSVSEKKPKMVTRYSSVTPQSTASKYSPLPHDLPAVLSLSGCSPNLQETDFFRQGPKGEHIEGWTSGIFKIIPSRDEKTLRFKDVYFLLFSSKAAARAYMTQAIRLHALSRFRGNDKHINIPPPPGYLKKGEDIDTLLKRYTLVPGFSKLSIREKTPPYGPKLQRFLLKGGPVAEASQKASSEHLVLFGTDVGYLNKYDLEGFLRKDGRRRNLKWDVSGGYTNILPVLETNLKSESEPTKRERPYKQSSSREPSRYIIPFTSDQEARRFTREWHRRPLPSKVGDEAVQIAKAELLW